MDSLGSYSEKYAHRPSNPGAGKHGEEGRRRRGQRRTRYSLQAFEPWFPHPMAPNRGGRWRAPSARQGEVRSRPDLHPTMDRLLATSQIADPFKPNVNLSSLGVDTQMVSGELEVRCPAWINFPKITIPLSAMDVRAELGEAIERRAVLR